MAPILRLPGQSGSAQPGHGRGHPFCVTAGSWSSLRGWWSVTLGKFAARVEVTHRAARTGIVIDDGHAVARRFETLTLRGITVRNTLLPKY